MNYKLEGAIKKSKKSSFSQKRKKKYNIKTNAKKKLKKILEFFATKKE